MATQAAPQRSADAAASIPLQLPTVYFDRLDAIRGTAILWVFVFHFCGACCGWNTGEWYQPWETSAPWQAWPAWMVARACGMGAMGVPVFFVLSGFLIHYTFCRGLNRSTAQFWLRRFGRIYPPYFVALLVLALLGGHLGRTRGQTNFIHHALLIHNFNDDTLFGINGSFWSLAVEAQFYLLYPLLLGLRRLLGMSAVLWTSLAVKLAIVFAPALGLIRAGGDAAACLMLPERYFEWILGMYVADCLLAGRRAFACPGSVGWLCFGAAFCAAPGWLAASNVPLVSLGTAIWIDRVVRDRRQPSRIERLLMPIGVVSYSLYLWHQPIVNEVVARMLHGGAASKTMPPAVSLLCGLAVAGVISALVAVGSYRLTEAPAMEATKWLVKWLGTAPHKEPAPRSSKLAA